MSDDELRLLFSEEAATRLDRMSEQLLEIEEHGPDAERIATIFRDAHTIKGSAAIVQLPAVAAVAHGMEDLLEQLRAGTRPVTPALVDSLLTAVDGLRQAMPALLAGADRSADLAALEAGLRQAADAGTAPEARAAAPPPDDPKEVAATPATGPPAPGRAPTAADVVRVPVERLDQLVRLVGEATAATLRVRRALGQRIGEPATAGMSELHELSRSLGELQDVAMRARMVPIASVTEPLRRAVREAARQLGKDVHWVLRGGETELDRGVLDELAEPLLHLVRNAVAHGIESPADRRLAGKSATGTVTVHAMQLGPEVIVAVADDGGGIDVDALRTDAAARGENTGTMTDSEAVELAFRPGVTTAGTIDGVSGRGVGLDVVRAKLAAVRGRVEVRSEPGSGTEFRVIVPITLAVLPCMVATTGHWTIAIPLHAVAVVVPPDAARVQLEGHPAVMVDGAPILTSRMADVLGAPAPEAGPFVIVRTLSGRHGFEVGALVGERDVVVKALPPLLPRLPAVAGVSLEPDGSVMPVLDPAGLVDVARNTAPTPASTVAGRDTPGGRGTILVVDDALTVRELQRTILERARYDVRTASDGVEALDRLGEEPVDLVLTDIEMPRLDGFELTEAIRAHATLQNIGVLILTSRASDEDRRRALDAGADGYIVKSAFDEGALLAAVARVLGGSG